MGLSLDSFLARVTQTSAHAQLLFLIYYFAGETLHYVVFRGTGNRISAAEKAQYHPLIHVDFQPKAWVDGGVLRKWTDKYVSSAFLLHGKHILSPMAHADDHAHKNSCFHAHTLTTASTAPGRATKARARNSCSSTGSTVKQMYVQVVHLPALVNGAVRVHVFANHSSFFPPLTLYTGGVAQVHVTDMQLGRVGLSWRMHGSRTAFRPGLRQIRQTRVQQCTAGTNGVFVW